MDTSKETLDVKEAPEFEPVEQELLDYVEKEAEENTLKKYGVYDDHDDRVRAEKKKKHARDGFHDTVTFQNQLFHVDEVHGENKIVGKFCVVMVPDDKIDQLLMFSFRTDPGRPNRPVIFNSCDDCVYWLRICYANPQIARVIEITKTMYGNNNFRSTGAFLMRPSDIILPSQLHKRALDKPVD